MFFGLLLLLIIIWYFMKNPEAAKKLGEFQNSSEESKKETLKILNEMFVNGKITEEECLRKKKLIE
ncbi:MAG: hypothetical protein B6I29_00585 [Marinitoga sp. 4572_148]|nr:MAG: hypothetical protein B6I29_00585 [Marinitoga sp. 4572_148]